MADEVLTLRFDGPSLTDGSLPIYELGISMIAVQRLVHKTALFRQDRLEKGARLDARQREELALQVATRRQGSDAWVFQPYLTDPAYGPIVQTLIAAALVAVGSYVKKKVMPGKRPPQNQKLIVNIFPEVRALTDRIDNIGTVSQIGLITGDGTPPLVLTRETQKYVREIENRLVPGLPCEIIGRVTRLHPQSFRLDIEDTPKHYIHVRMPEPLFEKVRRLQVLQGRRIKIRGVPMYRLGDASEIAEFQAERVILLRQRSD